MTCSRGECEPSASMPNGVQFLFCSPLSAPSPRVSFSAALPLSLSLSLSLCVPGSSTFNLQEKEMLYYNHYLQTISQHHDFQTISQRHDQNSINVDVAEVFSPPRLCKRAHLHDLVSGFSLDLTHADPYTGKSWDLSNPDVVKSVWGLLYKSKPGLLVLSPPC